MPFLFPSHLLQSKVKEGELVWSKCARLPELCERIRDFQGFFMKLALTVRRCAGEQHVGHVDDYVVAATVASAPAPGVAAEAGDADDA